MVEIEQFFNGVLGDLGLFHIYLVLRSTELEWYRFMVWSLAHVDSSKIDYDSFIGYGFIKNRN